MAHGESDGIANIAAIASGTGGAVDRGVFVVPGAPGAAKRVRAVHRVSLRMEYEKSGKLAGVGGCVRGDCVGRDGGAVREEAGRANRIDVGTVVGGAGIRGICAGMEGLANAGGDSLHCVVGSGGAVGAVADVAAGGCNVAGETARGDQFAASADGDVGATVVYASIFRSDFTNG